MSGRIPQSFIDQLLNRIDIVDLIDGYVPLKKAGANFKACCPFHNEKTPSFTVSQSKQFYHCFGCGVNGTSISFLMEYDHMEFRDAVEHLANSAGLEIPTEAISNNQHYNNQQTKQGVDLYALMDKVNAFYQQQLRQHPQKQQTIDYLQNRGLSGEIAKKFSLGFAPDGWDNLLKELGNTAETKKALVDTGMLSKNDKDRIYDRFRQRVMFPIHDYRGRIVGFGGRILNSDSNEAKYLNSPETPIFHKGSELYGLYLARGDIKKQENVLVVEGYMDVVALAQHDINHCVATLGTATTRMHLERLFRFTSNITFCFDGDRAGKQAAWKALETYIPVLDDGKSINFLFLPDGEDPDSMVRKIGTEKFLSLINKAVPLLEFLLQTATSVADKNNIAGITKIIKFVEPLLKKMPRSNMKSILSERFAAISNEDYDALKSMTAEKTEKYTHQYKPKKNAPLSPIRNAISLLLQHPKLAIMIGDLTELKQSDLRGYDTFVSLAETILQHQGVNTASLLERYREETHFSALEKLASHHHMVDEDQLETTFQAVLQQLKHALVEQQLEQLIEKSKHQNLNDNEKEQLKSLISQNSAI